MFFALAPMDGLMRGMTFALLALPALFIAPSLLFSGPVATGSIATALFIGIVYGLVYLTMRPRGFSVEPGVVTVVFPLWSRRVDGITHAEPMDRDELKRRYGWQARVGVGGLWGGFGCLYSTKGWMEFYVSRMDGYVLLTRAEGLPLLLSPERADVFRATVNPA